jgi:hypothetical protein
MFRVMKKCLVLALGLLLGGCSDAQWDHALNYTGLGDEPDAQDAQVQKSEPATAASEPSAPAAAPNADFCHAVAVQDATSNDFDAATQVRVLARSYAQCMTIYSR